MTVQPAVPIEPSSSSLGIVRLTRQKPLRLVGVATTGFVGGMAEALFLVLIVRVIVSITEHDEQVQLIGTLTVGRSNVMVIAAIALLVRLVTALLTSKQAALLSNDMVAAARKRLFRSYFGAEWMTQREEPSGAIQEYSATYTNSIVSYLNALVRCIVGSANLSALLAVAFVLDPIGAVALIATIAALGALLWPLRAAIGRRSHRANTARMNLSTTVSNYSSLSLEFRVFNVTEAVEATLDDLTETSRHKGVRFTFLAGLASPLYSVLAYVALLGVVVVISLLDPGEVSALAAVMLLVLRSLTYGQAVQGSLSAMSASRPIADELFEKIARLEAAQQTPGIERVEELNVVEARGVGFEYDPGTEVLTDVNFKIGRREIVGVVGPSGSGKSTLVQLLLGLRNPTRGAVLADGVDVRSIEAADWSRLVTFVPQSPGFLAGTIRENIRFLRDEASDQDVENAARQANLLSEIERHGEGLDRDVGEGGGHLSGGQQQRLSIARALVGSPQLLILDEPSSALDARSEQLLRITLSGLRDRMTVLIIAHRLTTLDICDRIMVVQDGHLVDFDTPSNLARHSEFYRDALELSGLSVPEGRDS